MKNGNNNGTHRVLWGQHELKYVTLHFTFAFTVVSAT